MKNYNVQLSIIQNKKLTKAKYNQCFSMLYYNTGFNHLKGESGEQTFSLNFANKYIYINDFTTNETKKYIKLHKTTSKHNKRNHTMHNHNNKKRKIYQNQTTQHIQPIPHTTQLHQKPMVRT